MYLSLICFAVMFTLNVTLVRAIGIPGGYIGAAWAALGGYFTVMVISYFLGQKYYPIRYPVGRLGGYVLLAAAFYGAGTYLVDTPWEALTLALRTLLLIAFVAVIVRREHVPIPRLLRHHC